MSYAGMCHEHGPYNDPGCTRCPVSPICKTCGHPTPHKRLGPVKDLNEFKHADACEWCECINNPAFIVQDITRAPRFGDCETASNLDEAISATYEALTDIHAGRHESTPHPSIFDTIAYAVALHEDQHDKAGVPYIAHPLSVMRRVPEGMWHVAVLHDAKEDCGVTDDDLREAGYTEEEITAIDLLTRKPGDQYHHFIDRIATSDNLTAITVKLADLDDNLDPSRGWKMPPQLFSRYVDARTRLQMVKEGR